ncbi:hypothetical protein DOTSEDRAFT_174104 [Dothistroma septosporum NZE10]|uniref:MINDY deubiquitinase domain-containing protein n=1 Tax=Dothistroma septosporum (strain NZE10 / CBS 128990) TaxID=675120 RepID=M2Y4W7_DOTSN|nr:hypothetical protein DOTSEDRAFT_174104 [Dothistroma septosporum NZE10]
MVTRKPVAPQADTAAATAASNARPPYPQTPTVQSAKTDPSSIYSQDLNTSPAFDLIDMGEARQRPRRDSDVSSHGTWDSEGSDRDDETPGDFVEVPQPLKIRSSQQNIQQDFKEDNKDKLPAILRPGPANGLAGVGTRGQEQQSYEEEVKSNPWQLESKNPYLQKQQTGPTESSQKVWEQPTHQPPPPPPLPAQPPPVPLIALPSAPAVELPTVTTPADELSRLSLSDRQSQGTAATWETAENFEVPQHGQSPFPHPPKATFSGSLAGSPSATFPQSNPWSEGHEVSPPPTAPPKDPLTPARQQQPEFAPPPGPPPVKPAEPVYTPPPGQPPAQAGPLVDRGEQPMPAPTPISTQAQSSAMRSNESVPETPGTRARRQKSETYLIKHINWQDASPGRPEMRRSPILIQNENGPCPLLALVNALVLSTPASLDTALIETLRTREQVSLGLLLDAVIDELMSGRRGDAAEGLPDVVDLYSFLLALHTGMNVNPRFVTPATPQRGSYDGHPSSMNGVHPVHRAQHKPGCFEETREMRLYSTFSVPLIHGWIAPYNTPAYSAFERSARTFEDAQNIQFAEADLEHKLRSEGLNFQEQQNLEDIQLIKQFLRNWPTQLTDYGLETTTSSLQPGQIAILFRNNHFSTLYKEPKHGALMTLVTDAGYSSHDEIVWESLVDVNGAASEMFSGDFRTVSHGQDAMLNLNMSAAGSEDWQNVNKRIRYHDQRPSAPAGTVVQSTGELDETPPPLPGPRPASTRTSENVDSADSQSPALSPSEQEDHDLALALQLQEEEEDQQRQAEERRRREQQLSEQFLSSEERPPQIPPRRSQGGRGGSTMNMPVTGRRTTGPSARPAVNRPADDGNPDAPPTYEQSASDRPYRPAGATAPPTQGNPLNALDALRRQQNGFAQQSPISVNSAGVQTQHGRRLSGNRIRRRSSQMGVGGDGPAPAYPGRTHVQGAANLNDTQDERCVIM